MEDENFITYNVFETILRITCLRVIMRRGIMTM